MVDSSVSMSLVMDDEQFAEIDEVLDLIATRGIVVPRLWSYEVANALLVAARRGRLESTECRPRLSHLLVLPITFDVDQSEYMLFAILELAWQHSLTVYDAAYMELAGRRRTILATLDDRMARAAIAEGIEVIGT